MTFIAPHTTATTMDGLTIERFTPPTELTIVQSDKNQSSFVSCYFTLSQKRNKAFRSKRCFDGKTFLLLTQFTKAFLAYACRQSYDPKCSVGRLPFAI